MSDDTVSYSVNNSIATLKIDRPEVMNAFRIEEFTYLVNGISLAENDPDVKVIRILSSGSRAFSGGLDLAMVGELATSPDKIKELLDMGDQIMNLFAKSGKPVVIQVQGPAVGWGAVLCLIADFVIAGDNAKTFFQLNEIDVGIFPATGALSSALIQLGIRQAKRMLLIPEKIYLDQAEKINLVTKRVTLDTLEEETVKFCGKLAEKELFLLTSVKKMLNVQHITNLNNNLAKEKEVITLLLKEDTEKIQSYFDSLWQN